MPVQHGCVVDAAGNPVPGAMVMVARGTALTPETAQRCDGHGRFHLALPPGRFTIEAHAEDGRRGSAEVSGGASGELGPLCIRVH